MRNTPLVRLGLLYGSLLLALLVTWAAGTAWAGGAVLAVGGALSLLLRLFGSRGRAHERPQREAERPRERPSRGMLAAIFAVTAVLVASGDYMITDVKSVALSTVLGVACGLAVLYVILKGSRRPGG